MTNEALMSFPVNLLSTEDIQSELKRRKSLEVEEIRARIAEHRKAIKELEARIALASKARRGR